MMMIRKSVPYCVTIVLCMVLSEPVLAGGNLVANPGFETGDFTGWSLTGTSDAVGDTVVASAGFNSWLPNSGTFFAALGALGSDSTLSQTIATTAGQTYTFSWFLGSDGSTPSDFSAFWNGSTILSLVDAPATPGYTRGTSTASYAFYSFTEVATSASTVIQFNSRNDQNYWAFDDVSVSLAAVPEPSSLVLSAIAVLTLAGFAGRRWCRANV
jgi:PEP-CTERM motif